ncbi:type II toxin-antitoxin system YafQ family toxin [Methylobacterium sp. WL64]|uniref:type II toxin-antitoxin system YafQ family toxin n=1 Tax=Methylobacterium sp. WL64 TaxID=2603894 RepID=UPI0011C81334|nr:type II toxin-antitoxin system YafQ family toxin [Methylobacterium sp. WL64]TXN03715.1 type II toxin-antitoxin system YafQ family toxin [Methylobacterium sp. WL64]
MRTMECTGQFRRDYRREMKGRYRATRVADLSPVIDALMVDQTLDARYRDPTPVGNWRDHRDCHIKPDFVLLHRLPDAPSIRLVRLGSQAELGL